jgi:ADP-heptose:LPS heptosyltransferase
MGDVAMLVPVLSKLIETYPNVEITLLTRRYFTPIFSSFSNITIVEAQVKGRHKGIVGLYRLYKELNGLRIASVADIHNVLRSNVLKYFFKLSGNVVVQIDKGRKEKKALTRAINKTLKQLKTTHQRYADVFDKLGFPIDLTEVKLLQKVPLNAKITTITGNKTQKWIGIAPFAAHKGKMYPLALMKEVIRELAKNEGNKILLFGGGAKEVVLLDEIANSIKNNVVNCAGKLAFKDELTLISNLDIMLSMDSGNAHLAANYAIPVVTLWGATHPYAGFAPFGQPIENMLLSDREKYPLIPTSIYGNKMPDGYEKVMETIPPDAVITRTVGVLKNHPV